MSRKRQSQRRSRAEPTAEASPSPRWVLAGIAVVIFISCVAYWPALRGGFIWDDNVLVVNNYLVKANDGLYRMWFTTEPFDYWPMTNSSFWLEWRLWGTNTTGYHVTNLILHISSALLIWMILKKLGIPGAYLAALLFAVHPVNVESVAWIAQRKNTLAMVFFLLSILWYLRQEEETRSKAARRDWGIGRWYWLSLLAFVAAMLSKGSVAILPLLLLITIWWRYRWITRADLLRTAPFFLVAAALTGVDIWFQTHGTGEVIRSANFAQRLAGAGAAVWFYLAKAIVPIEQLFVYPQWNVRAHDLMWWLPLLAAVVLTALLWRRRNLSEANSTRTPLFAWGVFCVALVPVMGFADVYFMKYSLAADHYEYVALVAVTALAAAGWNAWYRRSHGAGRSAAIVVVVAVVGTFALLTWQQSRLYADAITLYRDTLKKNPDCWMIQNNLGSELIEAGHPREAIVSLTQALQIKPTLAEAQTNLGIALAAMGRRPEAIEHFEAALKLEPDLAKALDHFGNALVDEGQTAEAIEKFEHALRFEPNFAEIRNDYANALYASNRPQEAVAQYRAALALKPEAAVIHNNLALVLANQGQTAEAIQHYQQSIRLKPEYAEAYDNLGNVLVELNRPSEAAQQYREALRIKPNYASARANLGLALLRMGNPEEAAEECRKAVELDHHSAEAYANLALALGKLNRTAEAIGAAQQALELARSQGQTSLVQQLENWLKSVRSENPNTNR